ncbi:MAG: cytochrome bc complex cytochrome b subunit [Thermoanaerobaculia bacterium]|nr:cytochrome bc complex cytochrome b subunit [Thermoanaerobaculia bacterium]
MATSREISRTRRFGRRLAELFPVDWELVRHASAEPVPHHLKKWWFALGGTPLYLFMVQIATGILLTFYYVPSPEQAYQSVAEITHQVRFGWFLRSLHMWSANFMVIAVFLHMFRVFFTRAYRHPRQLNWMVGFGLLGTTLTFGFTGYSLIYEQMSFWGATVAANLAEAVPLVGGFAADLLRGGPEVGEQTLTRFFILHIGVLPTVGLLLVALHVYLIRTHGVTELHFEGEEVATEKRFFRFYPEHVSTEILIGLLLMYLLTLLALVFPAELGPPADPTVTPEHIKPEWYFYFNFRLLKLFSLQVSVLLTMFLGGIAFFWPFIDGWISRRTKHADTIVVIVGVFAVLGFLILTVWEALAP